MKKKMVGGTYGMHERNEQLGAAVGVSEPHIMKAL
jgi:hypothetical protein